MSALDCLTEIHTKAIKPAFDDYVAAFKAMRTAGDADIPAVAAIQALERFKKAAGDAEAALREAVLASMIESGTLGFEAGPFQVTRVVASRTPIVQDEARLRAIAPDLFKAQPDKLDRTELARRLRAGTEIQGAALSNGGPGHIQIRGAK